jgi:hypothetical protein
MSTSSIATNAPARIKKPMLYGITSATQATSEGRILKVSRRHRVLSIWGNCNRKAPLNAAQE